MATKKTTKKKNEKAEAEEKAPTSTAEDMWAMLKRNNYRNAFFLVGFILGWAGHTVLF